jgi:hypothetical protein
MCHAGDEMSGTRRQFNIGKDAGTVEVEKTGYTGIHSFSIFSKNLELFSFNL